MCAWDFCCYLRFQAFPFIAEEEKRAPIRALFEMDVQNPTFQKLIQPLLGHNQFYHFCKIVRTYRPLLRVVRPTPVDWDLIETLFWEESSESLAYRMLGTLFTFPHTQYPNIWCVGTNLLLSARSVEEKESTLTFLEAYMDTWSARDLETETG